MAVSVFLPCLDVRVGATITSACSAYIAWRGLICVTTGHDGTAQLLTGWIDLSSLLFISVGTVRRRGMDFVADPLFDGRKIRALTIVDNYSRQCVAIQVGHSLKGEDVVAVMNQLKVIHLAVPQRIQVDNGSGFISKALDL